MPVSSYLNRLKDHNTKPVVVITGGSSGIGYAICTLFARKGFSVFEISRSGSSRLLATGEAIIHITGDVLDATSLTNAVTTILSQTPTIDLLIANAGYGISGSIEKTPEADFMRQLDLNYFGAVRFVQSFLPYMRQQQHGRIIFLSSLAGVLPIPFQAFYAASKAAIISTSRSLALELRPYGITTSSICPGDVKTSFTARRNKLCTNDTVYGERLNKSIAKMEHDETAGMSPEQIALVTYKVACQRNPRPLVVPGISYKLLNLLAKLLPLRLVDYILGKLYA